MSLATWKLEFYPVEAKDCPAEDAIVHSLRKWKGLRSAALEAHNISSGRYLIRAVDGKLAIDSATCALCATNPACETCPLFKVRDGYACETATPDELDEGRLSPFEEWQEECDPEPMIAALEAAARSAA